MKKDAEVPQERTGSRAPTGGDKNGPSAVSRAVGEALRAWRAEAGLSIREVAERSGLSVSFVSLLERGRTEVAVTRLIRLTDVFGRQISDIIGGTRSDNGAPRAAEDDLYGRSARAYGLADGVELVYLGQPEWTMQPFIFVLQPGAVHGPVIHSYSEYVVCLDGEGTMVIGDRRIRMSAGDILTIEPDTHHAYMNRGASTCRLLAIDSRIGDGVRVLLDTFAQMQRSRAEDQSEREGHGGLDVPGIPRTGRPAGSQPHRR